LTNKLPKLNSNVQNNNVKTCNLKFSKCDDNKYQLWDLKKDELKKFVSFAKKIENSTWNDIQVSKGYHYETIKNVILPNFISKDIVLKSLRVDNKFRIYGYRMEDDFYIIWFDPNHVLT
jgi:hypothetical protein